MPVEDCVFCNIAAKTIKADIIFENDDLLVLRDIFPKAPVHLLVVPREHIPSVTSLTPDQAQLVGMMVLTAQTEAVRQGIADTGYKLIFNVGKNGGQKINHLHLHLLGGKQLPE